MLSMPISFQATELPTSVTPPHVVTPPAPEPTAVEPPTTKCIRKLSQHVVDLLEGHGHTSNHSSDPVVLPGIQAPIIIIEELTPVLEGEGQAEWLISTDFVEELLMTSETSEAEALEPCTLAKAKCYPD